MSDPKDRRPHRQPAHTIGLITQRALQEPAHAAVKTASHDLTDLSPSPVVGRAQVCGC